MARKSQTAQKVREEPLSLADQAAASGSTARDHNDVMLSAGKVAAEFGMQVWMSLCGFPLPRKS